MTTRTKTPEIAPAKPGHVVVTVTKRGSGKVSNGQYDEVTHTYGYYERGDSFEVPLHIALALEEKALVEIED